MISNNLTHLLQKEGEKYTNALICEIICLILGSKLLCVRVEE